MQDPSTSRTVFYNYTREKVITEMYAKAKEKIEAVKLEVEKMPEVEGKVQAIQSLDNLLNELVRIPS